MKWFTITAIYKHATNKYYLQKTLIMASNGKVLKMELNNVTKCNNKSFFLDVQMKYHFPLFVDFLLKMIITRANNVKARHSSYPLWILYIWAMKVPATSKGLMYFCLKKILFLDQIFSFTFSFIWNLRGCRAFWSGHFCSNDFLYIILL